MKKQKFFSVLLSFFLTFSLGAQVPCNAVQNLSSGQQMALSPVMNLLDTALYYEDLHAIDSLSAEALNIIGAQAGYPESMDNFSSLTSATAWLSLSQALQLSHLLIAQDSLAYVDVWKLCKGMLPPQYLPHSVPLRAGAEICAGLLKMAAYETDLTRRNLYRSWAMRGLDSLMTMQLASGAFPFPDLRTYNDPVFTPIINNYLQSLGNDSVNVLLNGWIIDDSGTGDFKFDAGVICRAFAESYHYTGDTAYLQAAQRTAAYLQPLHFNSNYNYNTFAVSGLAETFAEDNNSNWLTRAAENLRYATVPGQTSFGAWMDGHNARASYHSIIIENSALCIALLPAAHPYRDSLEQMITAASRHFLQRFYACGSSAGYDGLMAVFPLDTSIIPQSLHDSIGDVIGRYINQSSINGRYLDVHTMGIYLELLGIISTAEEIKTGIVQSVSPNPFADELKIRFELKDAEKVKLQVLDLSGRQVAVLFEGVKNSGKTEINWKPGDMLSPGLYLLLLETETGRYSQKIIYSTH